MEENTVKISHILFMILMMGIIIVVGTYAWLSYRSNDTAMVLTIGEINNVQVTLSPYQIKASLLPQVTYASDNYTSVTAVNNSITARSFRLFYKISSIDNELISSDFKYTIERSTNGTTYSEYKSGNFSSASNDSELTILEERITGNNTTYQYKVYLWIDGTNSGQSYMQGKSFNGELRAEIAGSQYQFVEYLENKERQYIDTGFTPNQDTQIIVDFQYTKNNQGYRFVGSEHLNPTSDAFRFGTSIGVYWLVGYGSQGLKYVGSCDTERHILNFNKNIVYLDEEILYSFNYETFTSYGNAYIFSINSNAIADLTPAKLYSYKMYDNGVLIRDFVPAYRKSDNVRGLYDTVNDLFYTNASGSGTFEIGPEV